MTFGWMAENTEELFINNDLCRENDWTEGLV